MIFNALLIGVYMPVMPMRYLPGGAMHFMHRSYILFDGHKTDSTQTGQTGYLPAGDIARLGGFQICLEKRGSSLANPGHSHIPPMSCGVTFMLCP